MTHQNGFERSRPHRLSGWWGRGASTVGSDVPLDAPGETCGNSFRPAQRGDRRPRRSRQDHPRRQDAVAVRRVPREPGRRRTGHGLDGPREGEGDHDPGQEHGHPLPARRAGRHAGRSGQDQHRRHPRPRRLRRRGRASAVDGRRHPVAGRRQRRTAPPDPLRAPQGPRGPAPRDPGREQGRPPRLAHRRGRERGRGAVPRPRCRRAPDRLPHRLLRRSRGSFDDGAPGRRRRPAGGLHAGAPARPARRAHPGPRVRRGHAAAGLGHQPRLVAVPGPAGHVPGPQRRDPQGPERHVVPGRRHPGTSADQRAVHHREPRAGAGRPRRPGRDHRHRRHRRDHHRRDARRPRRSASAAGHQHRRAEPVDDRRHQHLAAGREGRHQADRPLGQGPPRRRAGGQRVDPRAAHRAPRHLGGPGPRRAPARRAGRDHAPGGLRAHGGQAPGPDQGDRRRRCTSPSTG